MSKQKTQSSIAYLQTDYAESQLMGYSAFTTKFNCKSNFYHESAHKLHIHGI